MKGREVIFLATFIIGVIIKNNGLVMEIGVELVIK